ncbi:DUF1479-domain-containing protein [Myriangium duriaei CBS 260.36]|uniref:DUF1479-domain-containing protein n=1 Tax=Myriangium duriaei CBS 260.36 TaxID=1168546 RepID=A0A9P4JAR9_9PEZI|nr:DUF1479-domain-containing protein [Myriangium duriaei CBS 260.36]
MRHLPRRFTQLTTKINPRQTIPSRNVATASAQKREGTIADAFASLSGQKFEPLEPRFAAIKQDLIQGHEEAIHASWIRLLDQLRTETETIAKLGSNIVPQINFTDLANPSASFNHEYRKRGVAVVRGVLPENDALDLKADIRRYVAANPHTKAFPADNPQVYELYWSPSQIRARSHPSMLATHRFLLSYWHSASPAAQISSEPILYADRLRIRSPGDAKFALGPHIDGGGPERWEPSGYGLGKTYNAVFRGDWEAYDAWESSCRLPVESDLYAGAGACSAFRMAQGWLSVSHTGPNEGTLLVNPLLSLATAYVLLRPFFTPKTAPAGLLEGKASADELQDEQFLRADNWVLETPASSWLQGATPGRGQELSPALHPHLKLDQTMVHVPKVAPGDYVAWHCDTIHAVDKVHNGKGDSSVMYIPACPLTERNAKYLARQRDAFLQGIPAPDFPGGEGESRHVGRPGVADVAQVNDKAGMRAFGLERWNSEQEGLSEGEKKMLQIANETLGFAV